MRGKSRFKAGGAIWIALIAAALPQPAGAHQDPAGCTSSGSLVGIDSSSNLHTIKRNGDRLEIAVQVRNDGSSSLCSVSDAEVKVQLPAPDGTATGPLLTVATDLDLPAGTPPTILPTKVPYEVQLNDGVFSAPVSAQISGTGHFGDPDTTTGGGHTTNVVISRPHITLTVTPSATSGPAPFGVTYTYTATNDSPVDPAQPSNTPDLGAPEDRTIISDDLCSPVTYASGDTDMSSPPYLNDGETWTLTCTRSFARPGSFTNTASIVGDSSRDGRPWPETTAQSTITAVGPDLTTSKSHSGEFVAGGGGYAYNLFARNSGNEPTTGTVTIQDSLPAGLSATGISGLGWSCSLASLSCNRSDPLAAGSSYPGVTLTVDVADDAPAQVTNTASVAGGGETFTSNNSAADTTQVGRPGSNASPGDDAPNDPPPPVPLPLDPPETDIVKIRTGDHAAKVRFRSDDPGATFECKLDKRGFRDCESPKRYRELDPGRHKVKVRAGDSAGNVDPTPAKRKFRIGR